MRGRAALRASAIDADSLIETLCDPDTTPEQQAEARQFAMEHLGPLAELVLRAAGLAAGAQRELATAREQLERMVAGTRLRGIVMGVNNGHVRVQIGPTERVLNRPPELVLGLGQTVFTDGSGQALLGAGEYVVGGSAFVVAERLDGRYVLVRSLREGGQEDARQLAVVAESVDIEALEPDDRVLGYVGIELGNLVLVTRRLGPAQVPTPADVGTTRIVRRDDIVGLDDVIERLERLFLTPPSPAYAALLGEVERAQAGVVLAGPAGCGKSLVADYLLGLVRAQGGQAILRTASYYLDKFVGVGAARVRADFAALDRAYEETGVRPLLVIDELEAIALDRTQGLMLHGGFLDVLDTLLATLTRSHARTIGISNVADRYLDAALVRDGRLPIVQFPATLAAAQVGTLVTKCLAGVSLAATGGTA